MLNVGGRLGSWGCSCRTLARCLAFSYREPPPTFPDWGGFFTIPPRKGLFRLFHYHRLSFCRFIFRLQRHANTNDDEQTSGGKPPPTSPRGGFCILLPSGRKGGGRLLQSLHQSVGEVLRKHHPLGGLVPALQGLAQSPVFISFLVLHRFQVF